LLTAGIGLIIELLIKRDGAEDHIADSIMDGWCTMPRGKQIVEQREDGASDGAIHQAITNSRQGVREAVGAVKARINGTEKGEKRRTI
jgi:hypothetical protein